MYNNPPPGQPPRQSGEQHTQQPIPAHVQPECGDPQSANAPYSTSPHGPLNGAQQQSASTALQAITQVRSQVAKVVVGQHEAVEALLIGLLVGGHVLLEGVPGVAKTLLVNTLGRTLDLDNTRVQFTPDLMPGDVTGSLVYETSRSEFAFREGPMFSNLFLADEINRTPPKTQAALLEAMEEHQVTADGVSRKLPDPFMVAATQNPVEYEGTYPLPEAQLDRFLLKVILHLPERNDEFEILRRHNNGFNAHHLQDAGVHPVVSAEVLPRARQEVSAVQVAQEVLAYIVDLVRATRTSPSLQLGVSPRGAIALMRTAKARAWLSGRRYVTPDDVQLMALQCLRHRVMLRPEAELDGVNIDQVLNSLLATVPVPR